MLYFIEHGKERMGDCILWWREGGKGYTINLDDAGRFEKEHAERICRLRPGIDKMHPVDIALASSERHVRFMMKYTGL